MAKEIIFMSAEDRTVLDLCKEEKLSVSSVKRSGDSDGECVEANLKVGSKLVGFVWDYKTEADYEYQGKDLDEFILRLDRVVERAPTFLCLENEIKYGRDSAVHLLMKEAENMKACRKKILLFASKSENEDFFGGFMAFTMGLDVLSYEKPLSSQLEYKIKEDMKSKGYLLYEIVNKRYE